MDAPKNPRPKAFPAPEFPPRRAPPFSRMPPAVFPSLMGLLGLGLALRRAFAALGIPAGIAEAALGATAALVAFALLAYAAKIARRPAVVIEDLRILPGRAGLAAASLSILLLAAVALPYSTATATALLYAGLALHLLLAALVIHSLITGPTETRGVTPVWHLHFVGFIIGGLTAVPLGMPILATVIFWITLPIAASIWGISLVQLIRRIPPAPLRPLLAIHLAPAALFSTVAAMQGLPIIAFFFAALGAVIFLALIAAGRWLTEAGFSPLWGAFTFPAAAFASSFFAQNLDATGVLVLMIALGIVPFVAARVLQSWAKGDLAAKTNAAQA